MGSSPFVAAAAATIPASARPTTAGLGRLAAVTLGAEREAIVAAAGASPAAWERKEHRGGKVGYNRIGVGVLAACFYEYDTIPVWTFFPDMSILELSFDAEIPTLFVMPSVMGIVEWSDTEYCLCQINMVLHHESEGSIYPIDWLWLCMVAVGAPPLLPSPLRPHFTRIFQNTAVYTCRYKPQPYPRPRHHTSTCPALI